MAQFNPGKIRRIKQKEESVYNFYAHPKKRGTFTEIQYSNGLRKRISGGEIRYYRYTSSGKTTLVRIIRPDGSITNYEGNYRDFLTGNPFQGSTVAYRDERFSKWIYV